MTAGNSQTSFGNISVLKKLGRVSCRTLTYMHVALVMFRDGNLVNSKDHGHLCKYDCTVEV